MARKNSIWGSIVLVIAIPVVFYFALPFFGATIGKLAVMIFGDITGIDVSGLMPYFDYEYLSKLFSGM